jgi:hypothetical protein
MASIAFANIAAAVAAGYKEIATDRGPQTQFGTQPAQPRWVVRLEKPITGEPGFSGGLYVAHGEGATQVAAEAVALAALNTQRGHRYGTDSNRNTDVRGGALALDGS